MPGYFEDAEGELEEEPRRDTEVTLGPGALVGIVAALLVLCGSCFGLGYWMGHRAPGRAQGLATPLSSHTAAPDEEPLQGSGSIPKPSAVAQVPTAPAAQESDGSQPQVPGAGSANPEAGTAREGQSVPPPVEPTAPAPAQSQPVVRSAMPSPPGSAQTAGTPPSVHPALPSANQLMVQVAAVSHQEDATVLINALRQHGYAASAQRELSDGLIHVRIGPFGTREEANQMARRLLDDGYNAMVQP